MPRETISKEERLVLAHRFRGFRSRSLASLFLGCVEEECAVRRAWWSKAPYLMVVGKQRQRKYTLSDIFHPARPTADISSYSQYCYEIMSRQWKINQLGQNPQDPVMAQSPVTWQPSL
jgi:hypothetical protein